MRCCLAPQAPPNLSPWLFVFANNITCTTWRLLATQPDPNWLYPPFSTAAEVAMTMTPKPMSTLVIFTVVNFEKRPYNVRFRSSFIVSASPCTKIKPFKTNIWHIFKTTIWRKPKIWSLPSALRHGSRNNAKLYVRVRVAPVAHSITSLPGLTVNELAFATHCQAEHLVHRVKAAFVAPCP